MAPFISFIGISSNNTKIQKFIKIRIIKKKLNETKYKEKKIIDKIFIFLKKKLVSNLIKKRLLRKKQNRQGWFVFFKLKLLTKIK